MRIPIRLISSALAALALAGCATVGIVGLKPGQSTESDVRRALGEPARTFAQSDGSRELVYPMGPAGMQTFMARISSSGTLVALDQALVDERFRQIRPGTTTADEIERLIGPPWRKIAFPNKGQVAWDYVYRDTWDYVVDLSVMIDGRGIVAETVQRSTPRCRHW